MTEVLRERSPEAKRAYIEGYRAGANRALAGVDNGLPTDEVRRVMDVEVQIALAPIPAYPPTEGTQDA